MSSVRRTLVCALSWLAVVASPTPARAPLEPTDRTLSPYFFVRGGDPAEDRLPLEQTVVEVSSLGVIAEVTVRQTYKNEGQQPIHARYVFPASTRAAVHAMSMTVGYQRVVARIEKRERARQQFEQAKREGKSASLLEQQRPNVFSMEVANVMPGDRIEVELRYTELLVPTDGVYEFVYPTVVGPRYSAAPVSAASEEDRFVETPYLPENEAPTGRFEITAAIEAAVPIRELGSPSHAVLVDWSDDSRATVRLDPMESRAGDRDFILRYRLGGKELASGLMLYEGPEENHFLLMVQPPRSVRTEQIPPREYVFVVDVSGSMDGFPLDTAQELLAELIGSLRPSDSFNVILFSGGAYVMAPRSVPATRDNIETAVRTIERQRGGGGTELLQAMRTAMELPHEAGSSRSFVLVSDGFISAEREVFDYIRQHLGEANVFAFGIGSSVNRYLIEGIARAGLGEPFVVTGPAEVAPVGRRFRDYVRSPVLTDIHLRFDGFAAYDVRPDALPDVLADRPIVVQGKWRGDPVGTITLEGISGSGPYSRSFEVHAFRSRRDHHALTYLWARNRIADLSDFVGSPSREQVDEITALGLQYNLLTRYTSFVAVYELLRNPDGAGTDVDQPLPLPRGVSRLAVGQGDEPALALLLPLVALLLASAYALQRTLRRAEKRTCR